MNLLLDALLVLVPALHVLLAPYAKVEESFNLHATHDVFFYGLSPSTLPLYDHNVFPGAVPRTFIGSIALAYASKPLVFLSSSLSALRSKADIQTICRLTLALANALVLCLFRRALARRCGAQTSALFALLTVSQFHLPFWMGRTIPNMFAFPLVTLAYAKLIDRAPNSNSNARRLGPTAANTRTALSLLLFAAVVFRAELVLLLAPQALIALTARQLSFRQLLNTFLLVGASSIALTTTLDSYLWRTPLFPLPLFPEASNIYFNVLQGKSAAWGVLPWHHYLLSALPRILLGAFPLFLLGLSSLFFGLGFGFGFGSPTARTARTPTLTLTLAPAVLVAGMSVLKHKEWRFIVYVVPMANAVAAIGANILITQKTARRRVAGAVVVGGIVALNVLGTAVLTHASMANYPGGVVLERFNAIYAHESNVHVHICNLAAQTGVSLFQSIHAPPSIHSPSHSPSPSHARSSNENETLSWTYNKTEHLSPGAITALGHFTHAIVEKAEVDAGLWGPSSDLFSSSSSSASSYSGNGNGWRVRECVKAFDGFRVSRAGVDEKNEDEGEKEGEGKVWPLTLMERFPFPFPRVWLAYSEKLCILERT